MACSCRHDFNLFKKVGRKNYLRCLSLSIALRDLRYFKVISLHASRDTISIKKLICKIIRHKGKSGFLIDREGAHEAIICGRCYKLIRKI